MLENIKPERILFLDIETVPLHASFAVMPEVEQKLWSNKARNLKRTDVDTDATIYPRAGIYAEFGKIICISVSFLHHQSGNVKLRVRSFYGDDEKKLLQDFSELLNIHFNSSDHFLCAHNGKEFDFPYLGRRILINNLPLPYLLDLAGKKPWEVAHLDTLQLWKFGDYKHYTPLNLLTHIFNIPSPKDDIDGSDIYHVYYQENDLERIKNYCQKDVISVAQLYLKFRNLPLLKEEQFEFV